MAISSGPDLLSAIVKGRDPGVVHRLLTEHQQLITDDFLEAVDQSAREALDTIGPDGAMILINAGLDACDVSSNDYFACRLLLTAADALARSGQVDDAVARLEEARTRSEALLETGHPMGRRLVLSAGLHLGDLEMRRGNPDDAARRFLETLKRARDLGSETAALWVYLNLIDVYLQQRDVESAEEYAQLLAKGVAQPRTDTTVEPPEGPAICARLLSVADRLYYEEEKPDESAAIAAMALQICPDDWNAFFFLGVSQLALKRFAEAAETWRRAIDHGHKRPAAYFNYASALSQLDRLDESLAAANAAIELDPGNERYHLQRAQWLRTAGKNELAIKDFTTTIYLCERQAAEVQPPPSQPRSMLQYNRSASAQDIADFARLGRIESALALHRVDEAEADVDYLIEDSDAVTASAAQVKRGELREAAQRFVDAEAAYSAALELNPDSSEALVHRADLRADHGRLEDAVSDLSLLADRNRDPDLAVDRLSRLLTRQPGVAYLLKARGCAYLEAWRPDLAVADLTAALRGMTPDAETLLARGLALVTTSPLPEEEAWNNALSRERIVGAIADLGSALDLAPDNRKARRAITWIVDRAIGDDLIFQALVRDGGEDQPIFRALPGFQRPARQFVRAQSLSTDRRWAEAITEYAQAQAGFVEAGLPVMASRIHQFLADNYLRLYELQMAFDHIRAAEEGLFLIGRPLSEELQEQADRAIAEERERTGSPVIAVEIDYLGLYGLGHGMYDGHLRLLKAQAYARLGDLDRAVAGLGKVSELGDAFEVKISAAIILRDAERYEEALDIIQDLLPTEMDDRQRIWLNVTAGSVCARLGQPEEAQQFFEAARQVAEQSEPSDLFAIIINEAGAGIAMDRPAQSLELLASIDIERVARSDFDNYAYYALQTQALLALNRPADAQAAASRALSIAETKRLDLRMPEARIAWQGKVQDVYDLAVRAGVAGTTTWTAFEFVERSRSRAFLDQLEAGHLPLPEAARHLTDLEANLTRVRELLMRLNEGLTVSGLDFAEPELLRRLRELDDRMDLLGPVTESPRRLDPEKVASELNTTSVRLQRIHDEIDEARARGSSMFAGSPLTADGLKELLSARAGSQPAVRPKSTKASS